MREKLRIVLDTNVLISAIFWKGNPHIILEKCKKREIDLVISNEILEEFKRILKKERKFEQTEKMIHERLYYLRRISEIVVLKEKIEVVKKDPKDNIVLECALAGNSDYVVTGDNHLLELKIFRGIEIVKPREMAKILRAL